MSAVIAYRCPVHGESPRASVNDHGQRTCADCHRVVDIVHKGDR